MQMDYFWTEQLHVMLPRLFDAKISKSADWVPWLDLVLMQSQFGFVINTWELIISP